MSTGAKFIQNSCQLTRSCSMEIISDFEKRKNEHSDNKDNQAYDYANLTIFNSPILSVKVLILCLFDFLTSAF